MDFKDIKVGQKVRCVYSIGLTNGKTATIVEAPATQHGQIVVEWDDGSAFDTKWSYASSFEPAEVPVPQKNNVYCICGYQDEWVASKDCKPACRVCAPKIALGDPNPSTEALKEEMEVAPIGNGFPKAREPEIALIKEAFTKLQDRTQYKVGDRIRVRIKGSKDIWATVILGRSTDCLLFLDEEYDVKTHRSWTTSDSIRQDIIKQLGLDPTLPRCFFWGDFSSGCASGTPDISVLHKVVPNLQDRAQYKHGDRIQISIKSGAARWATVLDQKSTYGTALYLDEAYEEDESLGAYSWKTKETDRTILIEELGLDADKPNCIFWGPGESSKTLKENEVKVLHVVDSSKVARVKVSEPTPPANLAPVKLEPIYKNGDRLQLKIGENITWATVVDDRGFFGNLTMPLLCLEQPHGKAHSDVPSDIAKDVENRGFSVKDLNFWWLEALDKVLHHGASLTNEPLKIGDALQYIGDNPIVGDNPPLVKGQTYRIRKLVPHDSTFKVFLEGFEGENDWWKTFRFEPVIPKIDNKFKAGDIVRCIKAEMTKLKKGLLYRVSLANKGFEKESRVMIEGSRDGSLFAERFEIFKTAEEAPIKYPVGARAQIHFGTKKEWGTIVGTVFGKGEERPIISMDANARWATGSAVSYLSEYGIDFTDTAKKLGLNESEPRCWLALPDEVLQVVPQGSAEVDLPLPEPPAPNPFVIKTQNIPPPPQPFTINIQDGSMSTNGGDLVFSGGINTIPLTIKFDLGEWKFQSEAPITINGKENAPINPETSGVDYGKDNISDAFPDKEEFTKLYTSFWKGFSKEVQEEHNKPKEQSFGSMVKEDAINAGYRVAANQLTKGVKAALLKLMEDRGADNNKVALIREILETEMGNALIAMILGMSLTYIPTLSEDKRAQKLAGEFRIGSMTTTGNALMDMVWQYVKNLPQTEKVRVNTNEVRVAEELEEEIVEDEKSSSLGV